MIFFASVQTAEGREGEGEGEERGGEGDASAQTRFLPRRRTVKTRPWVKPRPRGKRGCGRTSERHRRTSGQHPRTSGW
jgi:hypothetical protein